MKEVRGRTTLAEPGTPALAMIESPYCMNVSISGGKHAMNPGMTQQGVILASWGVPTEWEKQDMGLIGICSTSITRNALSIAAASPDDPKLPVSIGCANLVAMTILATLST